MSELQDQAVRQYCRSLRMPTIGGQFCRLADAAAREGQSHIGYLEALLAAEMEERESRAIARTLHEAKLPRMKTLEAFEFDRSSVSAARIRELAVGEYVAKAEPVLLVRLAPGRPIWRRACASPPVASDTGYASPPPRR
jgi:DNA replication protein DnaC